MKKLNNHFSQFVILGVVAGAGLSVAPAQAEVIPPFTATDGARIVLDSCPDNLRFLQKCDHNADVVKEAANLDAAGLEGSVNFVPVSDPGGVILQGTGYEDINGNPLTNIDFEPPAGQNIGRMLTVNAGIGSDFQAYQGWTGTIKDLRLTGTNGVPFPSPSNPRIRDFIRIDQPSPDGNGVVDGVQTVGFAFDAVYAGSPEYVEGQFTTRVTIATELQAYKLVNDNGVIKRIEEQVYIPTPPLTHSFNVIANGATGTFAASFPNEINGVPLQELFDEASDAPLSGFGYDISINTTPDVRTFTETEIPEPTTILSSLLLFGGGAFKLNRRKRA